MNITTIPPSIIEEDKIPVAVAYIPDEEAQEQLSGDEKRRPRYRRNKMILLGFFFLLSLLLGSWYAVNLSFDIFPRVIGPTREVTSTALANVIVEPREITAIWEQCIREEAAKCSNATKLAHDQESARVEAIQVSNTAKVEQASASETMCGSRVSHVNSAIRESLFNNSVLPWKTCPKEEQEAIFAIAGEEVRQGRQAIYDIFERTQERNRERLLIVKKFLEDYTKYHKDLVFGRLEDLMVKVLLEIEGLGDIDIPLPGFDAAIACLLPDDAADLAKDPCPIPSLSGSFLEVQNTIDAYIDVANEQIQAAAVAIAALLDSYDGTIEDIQRLLEVLKALRNTFGRPFDLALQSLGNINLDGFNNYTPGYQLIPKILDFPTIPNPPELQLLLVNLRIEFEKLHETSKQVIAAVKAQLKSDVADVILKVTELFDEFTRNYNPPKFPGFENATDYGFLVATFDDGADKIRAQLADAVNSLNVFGNSTTDEENFEFVPEEISIDISDNFTDPETLLLQIEAPSFLQVFYDLYEWGRKHSVQIDMGLRLLYWFLRFVHFFNQPAVPVPIIIVGTPGADCKEEEEQERKKKTSWWVKVVNFFSSEKARLILAFSLIVTFLIVVSVVLYRSIGHYQEKCVGEDPTGTSIPRSTVLPLIHNAFKFKGSSLMKGANAKLQTNKNNACVGLKATSGAVHQGLQARFFSAVYDYNKTMGESSIVLNCIDVPALGKNGTLLHEELQTCSLPLDVRLDDGVATCDDWPSCQLDDVCSDAGVSEAITRSVVENACVYEWSIISDIIIFSLKLFQYLCWAIVLLLVESAMFALFRKSLRPDTVKWVYEEDMETNQIVGAEGMSVEEAKAGALATFERWEKRIAVAKLLVAVALIIAVVFLRVTVAKREDFLQPEWFVWN